MKMYELLADKNSWCKFAHAVDAEGLDCGPWDKDAVRWCMAGAIYRCYCDPDGFPREEGVLHRLDRAIEVKLLERGVDVGYQSWQDRADVTHEMVVELLKELDI